MPSKPSTPHIEGAHIMVVGAVIAAVLWLMQPSKPSHADQLREDTADCVATGRAHSSEQFDQCMSDKWSLRNDAGSV